MPSFNEMFTGAPATPIRLLQFACEEIIPAGLNSAQGPLTPGSIEFIPTTVVDGLGVHVVIDVEAYSYDDRTADIEERAERIKQALSMMFPHCKFAVFLKLVVAGWSSDTEDPEFDGDMSIDAAMARYASRVIGYSLFDQS